MVAIYAAIVARNALAAALAVVEARELEASDSTVHQPQDPRLRTLDD
jgi:hypothetical protein